MWGVRQGSSDNVNRLRESRNPKRKLALVLMLSFFNMRSKKLIPALFERADN
jgi:hypothetical protein